MAIGAQAAIAIDNAQLYEETKRRATELGILYEVATAAAASIRLDETLNRAMATLQETLRPDDIAILLVEPETNELFIRAHTGFPGGPKLMRRPIGVGIPGWVVRTGQPALLADVREDERYQACDPDTRSELCVPLRVGERTIGALNLESRRLAAFSEDDLRLLSILAGNLVAIIENARLFEETEERRLYLEGLLGAAPDAIVTLDARHRIVEWNPGAERLFGYSREEVIGRDLDRLVTSPEVLEEATGFRQVVMGGKELPPVETVRYRKDGSPVDVLLAASPILVGDELIGIVTVYTDITTQKRAKEMLRRRAEELAALQATVLDITTPHDLPTLLQTIVERSTLLLNTPGGGLYLCHPDRGEVRCVVSYNTPRNYTGTVLKYGEGAAGIVAQTGESLIIDDYRTWSGRAAAYEEEQPFTAVLSAPMIWQGQVTGVIDVLHDVESRRFTEADLELLTLFANHAAIAVENSRLYEQAQEEITERKRAEEELQDSLEKLRKALGGTIQAIALTVERRDPYTAGHQRQVADLARAIATEMGLSKEQVDGIRMAGVIHDIGKTSVPSEILSKPGQLGDIEFSLIKTHPQVGYDILKTIDFPWPVAEIVLQHHERVDGSGYPQGLPGGEIMLEARILAVADVVAAMASHRPYRPPHGLDKALEEISQNKGVLYDPEVVDTCLKLFTEKGFKFE
jgi:PAS domain S-box-containing protein/putative nucleotidyltransferase with HDIG domain